MKDKIIEIFKASELDVISYDKLNEYVDFCLKNDKYVVGKSSHHHILPKAKNLPFTEYSDIKYKNKWNGAYLSFADHYKAHYLLSTAINHYSIHFAFIQMHNKDYKNGRLDISDLIDGEIYQTSKEECYANYENWLNEQIYFEENIITNRKMLSILRYRDMNRLVKNHNGDMVKRSVIVGEKVSITKNSKEWKETVGANSIEKMKETKKSFEYLMNVEPIRIEKFKESINRITENGLTVAQNTGIKISKALTAIKEDTGKSIAQERSEKSGEYKKNTIESNGKTISQNAVAKSVETMNIVGDDGTTIYQRTGLKSSEYQRNKGKWYKLCHINGDILNHRISNAEVKKMCQGLLKSTPEKYLGYSSLSKSRLNDAKKLHLVGLYVVEI